MLYINEILCFGKDKKNMMLIKTCNVGDQTEITKSGIHDNLSPQDLLFQQGPLVKRVKISCGWFRLKR